MENWFKYRLPGASGCVEGESANLIKGLDKGFVIAPFMNTEKGIVTIPYDGELHDADIRPVESILPDSTTREEHRKEVEHIVRTLNGKRGKTVASRAIRIDMAIDLNGTFRNLCSSYPEAFVFMFSTSATGTWIGASPELLIRQDNDTLTTMALAGTRKAGTSGKWDLKNIEEQAMVTEYIVKAMSRHAEKVSAGNLYTRKAGNVEHICTPITAKLPNTTEAASELPETGDFRRDNLEALKRLLCELSPTPAVCGSDREESLRVISMMEKHGREMYGGFCGPCRLNGDTALYVNLRSAKCTPEAVCIYAGGGITRLSDSDTEWNETEIKSQTIINKLKQSEV